jgi:hypothetical protein
MKEIVMKHARLALSFVAAVGGLVAISVPAQAESNWADEAAAAAAGYCLASHPYIQLPNGETYTSEGFEVLASPGVAGAVRRNYVFNRGPVDFSPKVPVDVGASQTCPQACTQWGHEYGANEQLVAAPLRIRRSPGAEPTPDGVDDLAAGVHFDADFYTYEQRVVVGMSGRPGQTQALGAGPGAGVAQADFCCCQLRQN